MNWTNVEKVFTHEFLLNQYFSSIQKDILLKMIPWLYASNGHYDKAIYYQIEAEYRGLEYELGDS